MALFGRIVAFFGREAVRRQPMDRCPGGVEARTSRFSIVKLGFGGDNLYPPRQRLYDFCPFLQRPLTSG